MKNKQVKAKYLTFFILLLFIFVQSDYIFSQSYPEKTRNILISKAGISEADFSKIQQGELFTKLLASENKREVAVLGITKINTPLDLTLKTFQETMSRQNKKSVIEMGNFSNSPIFEDINALKLEKVDIEDLKKCQVGNCSLKLSAPMIERFQKEIDWNAENHSEQAAILFKKLIFDYLQVYLARGDEALIEYQNERNKVSLRDEQISLLSNLLWIRDFAPEFYEYLKNFPRNDLPNIRKSVNWTKVTFGLKPVIILTQTITYTTEKEGVSQIISVSKQLYASRYFDSSLGLTALIKFPANDNFESYLFYTNHSRSSSLEGAFSQFKHDIVEREALEKLKPLLEDTKIYAEAALKNQNKISEPISEKDWTQWFTENIFVISGLSLAVIIGIFLIGRNRLQTKK